MDIEMIDRWYDTSVSNLGESLKFAAYDRRVLLPLSHIPDAVKCDGGGVLSFERIRDLAELGWFQIIPGAGEDESQEGVPIYIPSRIEMFLKLERQDWAQSELRAFAQYEEMMIDTVVAVDELAYEDDDAKLLISTWTDRIDTLDEEITSRLPDDQRPPDFFKSFWSSELENQSVEDLQERKKELQRFVALLQEHGLDKLSETIQERLARTAFRIRAWHEFIRTTLINEDRAKLEAGYSREIWFSGVRPMLITSENANRAFRKVDWNMTFLDPWTVERLNDRALRLPGFVLRGDQLTVTRPMPPSEYEKLYAAYDLDAYFRTRAVVLGERVCPQCLDPLEDEADPKRRFCSDRCRNAARQRRYRRRKAEVQDDALGGIDG